MHRHGYQGRKLGREKDQRRALLKGLADSLILNESIETTLAKAKQLLPYTEKLITRSKDPSLSNRRLVITKLHTLEATNKLFDDVAPKLKDRSSGHLRIEKTALRRGDNAQLARVSFIDDLKQAEKKPAKPKVARPAKPKQTAKKAKA
jgi:large subunit ribosomal protein L17